MKGKKELIRSWDNETGRKTCNRKKINKNKGGSLKTLKIDV